MSVQSVTLTGEAIRGYAPQLLSSLMLAEMPKEVMLGRLRPKAHPSVLRFGAFYDESRGSPPPLSINRRDKAAAALAHMYLNDRYGCCVISGKAHALGLWSIDTDSGGMVHATDQEIYSQYQSFCGPGDNGCNIADVLDIIRSRGFTAGGKSYKIDGYVSADWTNQKQVQAVQYLLGASTIGINLPGDWTNNAVWDVTNSRIVGGHDVTPIDYDEKGVYVSSWGRIYLITWRAFTSTKWLEEYYAILAPLWYGSDKLAPSGLNVTALQAALKTIGGGHIPDIDPPSPPPPPPPPPSPDGSWTIQKVVVFQGKGTKPDSITIK